MIPVMFFDIKNLVTNILKLFVKLEVIEGCKTASDLLEIDIYLKSIKSQLVLQQTNLDLT